MNPTQPHSTDPRQRLERRAAQLSEEIAQAQHLSAYTGDATHVVLDRKYLADARAHEGVADAEADRDRTELAEVQAALRRLADGSYGRCADCGEPIGAQRMLAQPAALRCLACQARQEAARRQHGTAQ
jgi:RNA polymerase-binding transcription factor DksA